MFVRNLIPKMQLTETFNKTEKKSPNLFMISLSWILSKDKDMIIERIKHFIVIEVLNRKVYVAVIIHNIQIIIR